MQNSRLRLFIVSTLTGIMLLTSACGVILYPDRKGQTNGQIDVGVAVLDGVGLLFFLIPGVVAYAVDFSTGAIYLPNTEDNPSIDMHNQGIFNTSQLDSQTPGFVIPQQPIQSAGSLAG